MDTRAQEPLPSGQGADATIHVLAAGTDEFRRSVAAALDTTDIALTDTTATADGVLDKLALGGVDCVVTDKSVGARNSLELFELIARKHRCPPAMILLSEDASAKALLKAFRTGLSDYVLRDHDYANELRQAVRRSVDRARTTRELHEEIDYLAKLAKSDRLTGLPNRTFLEERIASLAASGERHGGTFAVFLIDVDNFRQINDIYGHAVGDQALKAFARRLMLTSRASDAFGRFGGDEFIYVIDRAVSEETVSLVCDRLVTALSFAMDLEAVGLSLSASIGAATFPADATTTQGLLVAAGRAMTIAKRRASGFCLAHDAATSLAEEVKEPVNRAQPAAAPGADAFAGPRVVSSEEAPAGHRDENRRVEHRNRVFKRGRITFGDGFSTMDCVVRDLSSRGARLSVEDQVTLPPRFSFVVVELGETHPAVRRWQRGKSIGIEFWLEDEKRESAPAATPVEQRRA